MSSEKKCVLVQSKVSVDTAKLLDEIVEKYGFKSRYDILQYVLSAFLRVVDCEHEIPEDDKDLVEFCKMFEGFENAKNRVISVRPTTSKQMKLVNSINIYSEIGSKGYTCKVLSLVGEDYHTNASVSKALNLVLKKLHNGLYNKLQVIAEDEGEKRLERIIELLADNYHLEEENSKFINCQMSTFDGSPEYGHAPKRSRVIKHSYDE